MKYSLKNMARGAAGLIGAVESFRGDSRVIRNKERSLTINGSISRSNLMDQASDGFGRALVQSRHSGGFAPGTFTRSWNQLADDLAQHGYNLSAHRNNWLAHRVANRAMLLKDIQDAVFQTRSEQRNKRSEARTRTPIDSSARGLEAQR